MGSLVTTRPLVVVGGGGRIGRTLLRMQPDAQHLAVGRADLGTLGARLAAAADEPAPILVATTNDALPEVCVGGMGLKLPWQRAWQAIQAAGPPPRATAAGRRRLPARAAARPCVPPKRHAAAAAGAARPGGQHAGAAVHERVSRRQLQRRRAHRGLRQVRRRGGGWAGSATGGAAAASPPTKQPGTWLPPA